MRACVRCVGLLYLVRKCRNVEKNEAGGEERGGEGRGGGGGESVIVGLGYRLYPIQQLETRYRKFFPPMGWAAIRVE